MIFAPFGLSNAVCGTHPGVTFLLHLDTADVDTADNEGQTPLQYAAMRGDLDTARVLINAGADVHRANKDGYCPQHWAAKFNGALPSHFHLEVVVLLLVKKSSYSSDLLPPPSTSKCNLG